MNSSIDEILMYYGRIKTTDRVKNKYIYFAFKRVFDIICALLGILLLLPVMLFVKIIYVITGDFNPIMFVHKRIGKDGKEFKLYKFRTMVPNADIILQELLANNEVLEEEYRINKKLQNDPRITKAGKILRKTSLDELPQMLCVLQGTMSMIGNRPYLPREKDDMRYYYKDIIKTKPGLTGYWQVAGRNDTTFNQRLKLERFYSNNCGILMDIKIFFKTFKVVLFGKGAK